MHTTTRKKIRWSSILSQVLLYGFLIIVAVFIAFPFYWMVICTVKPEAELYKYVEVSSRICNKTTAQLNHLP